jgi:TusA-related sulfurtransferase
MRKIDTCGMSCPQPVLMTKKALEETPEGIEVVVDNNTAKANVSRFMKHTGYQVTVQEMGEHYIIVGEKSK